jgi:hypothetical protein
VTGSPRSFGSPRPRPAPPRWELTARDGSITTYDVTTPTLVVAVKPNCDGCRPFYVSPLPELGDLPIVVVAAQSLAETEFDTAIREVVAADELLAALEIRWPPFYVLVAPFPPRVALEGVVFSPAQVAAEIASWRASQAPGTMDASEGPQ